VLFYETDLAGVVHFSWYLRYMEEAEHAMWRAAGLSVAQSGSDIGFPRVSATITFSAPLRFEEEFEVDITIEAISKRSIRYLCEITRGSVRVATGTMTAACVRHEADRMQPIDIPDDVIAKLSARSSSAQ